MLVTYLIGCLVIGSVSSIIDYNVIGSWEEVSSINCTVVKPICPNKDISYYFFTRDTENSSYIIDVNDDNSIKSTPIVPNAPLVITLHGYTGNASFWPNVQLKPAFFKTGEYNIITPDYGKLAPKGCYHVGVVNADTVGKCIAQLLTKLYEAHTTLSPENTHVIGFSLGAHVAGYVGKYFKTLPWITGLDPAGPLFDDFQSIPRQRLDPTDAKFVDVVHTFSGPMGEISPSGHVDFYFNQGGLQPGCPRGDVCNHNRAVEFYAEAILNQSPGFWAQPCRLQVARFALGLSNLCVPNSNNYTQVMGPSVSKSARGTFQVFTAAQSPFALGKQ